MNNVEIVTTFKQIRVSSSPRRKPGSSSANLDSRPPTSRGQASRERHQKSKIDFLRVHHNLLTAAIFTEGALTSQNQCERSKSDHDNLLNLISHLSWPLAIVSPSSSMQPNDFAIPLSPCIAISHSRAICSSPAPCDCQAATSGQ